MKAMAVEIACRVRRKDKSMNLLEREMRTVAMF